jgi:uncharacterized protein YceK
MIRIFVLILLLSFLSLGSGCSTFVTIKEENKIYSGTRLNIEGIYRSISGDIQLGYLFLSGPDLPFSLVLDTVLLPYTIPNYLLLSEED